MTGSDVREPSRRDSGGVEYEPRPSPMTIAVFECSASDLALDETMAAFPDVTFECERGVQGCSSVMSLVLASDVRRDGLDAAVRADSSVDSATLVDDRGGDVRYHVEWVGGVEAVAGTLVYRC